MIKSIYHFIKKIESRVKDDLATKQIRSRSTFIGAGQCCKFGASVNLIGGSTKEDVIIHEHCDVYGNLISIKHGKIIMKPWSKIGPGTVINCVNSVEIGTDTAIATNVMIIDNNTHPICPADRRYMRHTPHGSDERQPWHSANKQIIIGENVWIGSNARICKGVTIGDNAIIAANSVVTHDVPSNAVVAGNPAKVVKEKIDECTTPIFPLTKE